MYLLEQTEEANEMRQNVINLLATQEKANIDLAIELMLGGGLIPETSTILWNFALYSKNTKKRVLKIFKQNLPENIYQMILQSFEYGKCFAAFVERYFEKIAQYQGFEWENLIKNMLPSLIEYDKQHFSENTKYFFLTHPQTPKKLVLEMLAESEQTYLNLSNIPLEEFPEDIDKLPNLREIHISDSKIKEPNDAFCNLKFLTSFSYYNTPFEKNLEANLQKIKQKNRILFASIKMQNLYYNDVEKVEKLEEIIHEVPEAEEVYFELISTYNRLNRHQKVLETFEKYGVKTNESYSINWVYFTKGQAYFKTKQYKESIEEFKKCIDTEYDNDSLWYELARVYLTLKEYSLAEEAISKAIEHYAIAKYYILLANIYIETNAPQKAISTYVDALSVPIYEVGEILEVMYPLAKQLNDFKAFDTHLQKFIHNINYNYNAEISKYANILVAQEKYKEAIAQYEKALKLYEYDSTVLSQYGICCIKMKNYKKAEVLFYKNYMNNKTEENAAYNLACSLILQDDKPNTIKYLKEAIKINEDYKEYWKTDIDFKNYWNDEELLNVFS